MAVSIHVYPTIYDGGEETERNLFSSFNQKPKQMSSNHRHLILVDSMLLETYVGYSQCKQKMMSFRGRLAGPK